MKKIGGIPGVEPHNGVKLSQQEKDMIRYWIESAACYPGTYAALGHGSVGGYQQNRQIHTDNGWPTAKPAADAINARCIECHQKQLGMPLPRHMSDELGISFWRFNPNDPKLQFSRHLMFNLTRPENSMLLLAPLPKKAGGLGLCRATKDSEEELAVFESTNDPDYRAIHAHITVGKNYLENELTRFDMTQFRPRPEYYREMRRYGLLPPEFDPAKDQTDVYELDRKYWESLWYYPPGKEPKLYQNVDPVVADQAVSAE